MVMPPPAPIVYDDPKLTAAAKRGAITGQMAGTFPVPVFYCAMFGWHSHGHSLKMQLGDHWRIVGNDAVLNGLLPVASNRNLGARCAESI